MKLQPSIARVSLLLLLSGGIASAQLTLSNGEHNMEFGGGLTVFGNYRIYKPGQNTDKSDNRMGVRDAQFQIEGRVKNTWEYKMQVDFADIIGGLGDPENPGILDAHFTYKGCSLFNINAGFNKIAYSRANQVGFSHSPFFQRAEIVRGQIFSRRDIGITLSQTYWKQRVSVSVGAYNGLGEGSLKANGTNDASGGFEYVARAEVSYPTRNRYLDIDDKCSIKPVWALGVNGRYAEKASTMSGDNYYLKYVAGKKLVYGVDASIKYKGFSAQAELHRADITPTNKARLEGKPTTFFRAGGYYVQASYYLKPLKSSFSLRYDEMNASDLVTGVGTRLTGGYCYYVRGYNSVIKLNYTRILKEEITTYNNGASWNGQFRIGWQLLFS